MQILNYKKDIRDLAPEALQGWTVVTVDIPIRTSTIHTQKDWLTRSPSKGKFFFQPTAVAFWFEDRAAAMLYILRFGGGPASVYDPVGIRKCQQS